MLQTPHAIPYQGSKRSVANLILGFAGQKYDRFLDVFAGSGSMTIAAASRNVAKKYIINDFNTPLAELHRNIIELPKQISAEYKNIWEGQIDESEDYYNKIRFEFNNDKSPSKLLYLLARCVKSSVRYNNLGEFNQSHDKRRLGTYPKTMTHNIQSISDILKSKTCVSSVDYREVISSSNSSDLIYLDPPYQNTGKNGGFRYSHDINHPQLYNTISELITKNQNVILSYDGMTGNRSHGFFDFTKLGMRKILIDMGKSSQATLLKRSENSFESLYLSPSLVNQNNNNMIKENYQRQDDAKQYLLAF